MCIGTRPSLPACPEMGAMPAGSGSRVRAALRAGMRPWSGRGNGEIVLLTLVGTGSYRQPRSRASALARLATLPPVSVGGAPHLARVPMRPWQSNRDHNGRESCFAKVVDAP